jgi:hypothetical protein
MAWHDVFSACIATRHSGVLVDDGVNESVGVGLDWREFG